MGVHSKQIVLNSLISNVQCTIVESVGDAVYFSSNNTVSRADASDISTARVSGFIESKQSNTECVVRIGGTLSKSGLSINTYFLDTSPGQISINPPTASGNVVVKVGFGKSSTKLLVEVSQNRVIRS